ncbi:MAG: hypothetical protein H6710_21750 [Myxococcales bacterium]|nr:hypothetical protein [Myxococcales bacterium]
MVADLGGTALLTGLATFFPWLILTISIGAGLGLGVGYGLGVVAAGICGWLLTLSQVWRRLSRSRRAHLERILEAALAEGRTGGPQALSSGDDDER